MSKILKKTCLDCGKEKSEKGLYCKPCGYKHRKRPRGLKYKIVVQNRSWFKKGVNNWLGKKHSEETKKLWSKNRKGKRVSIKSEFKQGQNCGEKNNNWKGGITPLTKQIRHSFEYRQWISDVFTRDNYTCQNCGIRGGILHAHHIKMFNKIINEYHIRTLENALNCEELWNINNGKTLCKKCHLKKQ